MNANNPEGTLNHQEFTQALLSEHLLIVTCDSYRPVEEIIKQVTMHLPESKKLSIALPYSALSSAKSQLNDLHVWKGLNDLPSTLPNAFSQNVAIQLALECDADFVVIGTPNSRHILYESDLGIAAKIKAVLEAGITPVVCFGESYQDYQRGNARTVIEEQLRTLLLGLSFDQIIRVILVYKAPWINNIAPENFIEAFNHSHKEVLDVMQHLYGNEAASQISILTDLPLIIEDFSKITFDLPPSGYFLHLEGREPSLIHDYLNTLSHQPIELPEPTPTKTTKRGRKKNEKTDPIQAEEPKEPEQETTTKKPRKTRAKKETPKLEADVEIEQISEDENPNETVLEETTNETILSIDKEIEEPTLHFSPHEPEEDQEGFESSSTEDFELEWYSEEELEALRKEFGILPDGTKIQRTPPVWDSNRPVRIIKTKAQKSASPDKKPQ